MYQVCAFYTRHANYEEIGHRKFPSCRQWDRHENEGLCRLAGFYAYCRVASSCSHRKGNAKHMYIFQCNSSSTNCSIKIDHDNLATPISFVPVHVNKFQCLLLFIVDANEKSREREKQNEYKIYTTYKTYTILIIKR